MTTTTIFSSTEDGRISSQGSSSYATARAMGSVDVTNTSIIVGQNYDGFDYICYEGFVSFDTSAIDDAETVSAAVLSMYGMNDFSTTNFTVEAREHDWGAALTSGDAVAGASLSGKTLLASLSTVGFAFAYNAFTSQAAFLTATGMKTGGVYIILASSRQTAGTTPSDGVFERVEFYDADEAGTTKDPKLVVTSAAVALGFPLHTIGRQAVKRASYW